MRRLAILALTLAIPVGCADDSRCGEASDRLIAAGEAMQDDPTVENMQRASAANQRWLAAGCDRP